jgi:hypothetical protein
MGSTSGRIGLVLWVTTCCISCRGRQYSIAAQDSNCLLLVKAFSGYPKEKEVELIKNLQIGANTEETPEDKKRQSLTKHSKRGRRYSNRMVGRS